MIGSGRHWMKRRWWPVVFLAVILGGSIGAAPVPQPVVVAASGIIRETGLLDALARAFEMRSGLKIQAQPAELEEAGRLARQGVADAFLLDLPEGDEQFLTAGDAARQHALFVVDLVIVGPASDPASIRGAGPAMAFRQILGGGHRFVAPPAGSGTAAVEALIWGRAEVSPQGPSYIRGAKDARAALRQAAREKAYTLTDRPTFLALEPGHQMAILVEGKSVLKTVYTLIEAGPARRPKGNPAGGRALADFLLSAEGQALIRSFGAVQFGQPLFRVPGP